MTTIGDWFALLPIPLKALVNPDKSGDCCPDFTPLP